MPISSRRQSQITQMEDVLMLSLELLPLWERDEWMEWLPLSPFQALTNLALTSNSFIYVITDALADDSPAMTDALLQWNSYFRATVRKRERREGDDWCCRSISSTSNQQLILDVNPISLILDSESSTISPTLSLVWLCMSAIEPKYTMWVRDEGRKGRGEGMEWERRLKVFYNHLNSIVYKSQLMLTVDREECGNGLVKTVMIENKNENLILMSKGSEWMKRKKEGKRELSRRILPCYHKSNGRESRWRHSSYCCQTGLSHYLVFIPSNPSQLIFYRSGEWRTRFLVITTSEWLPIQQQLLAIFVLTRQWIIILPYHLSFFPGKLPDSWSESSRSLLEYHHWYWSGWSIISTTRWNWQSSRIPCWQFTRSRWLGSCFLFP